MAQTENNKITSIDAKAACVIAFIPSKSALQLGFLEKSENAEDADVRISVGVYHADGSIHAILNFADSVKALRYAYILKERESCPISK